MSPEPRRWFDQSQPQTLQIAVFLLYAMAVFNILFGSDRGLFQLALLEVLRSTSALTLGRFVWFVVSLAAAGAGFLIANGRKAGYTLGIAAAIAPLAARLLVFVFEQISPLNDLLSLLFDVALVALLLHPMSKEYVKLWFR